MRVGHHFAAQRLLQRQPSDDGASRAEYSASNFGNTLRNGRHWVDELSGVTRFDTSQVTVDRNAGANSVRFDFVTKFSGTDPESPARYADIFLNTTNPTAFGESYSYAIALGSQTQSAGLYALDTYATSMDVWSSRTQFAYGG